MLPGENVRLLGTDFDRGARVMGESAKLGPEHLMALASLGVERVEVRRRLKVALVATGSEVVPADTRQLPPGKIRNSSGALLRAALRAWGAEVLDMGIVEDDPQLYREKLERACEDGADVVVSTGAVSMGRFDFVMPVLREMGARVYFHKAAIRPGKPVCFARLGGGEGPVLLGAPGNPVSTFVALRFFLEPYFRRKLGLNRELPVRAKLSADCSKPEGLRCFLKAKLTVSPRGELAVEVHRAQGSYVVSALLDCNAWVVLPENGVKFRSGEAVDVLPLGNSFEGGFWS
ncbi:MAG: molybdopterin molybdotransferase MoeA [Bdellovibrionales bacterium]|nr:molybdopterin molybdotransferase MoeA [Bdellovibrionales bacterium]